MLTWLSPRKIFIPVQRKIEKEWTGSDYGGFYVHLPVLNEESVVLSFGVGEDVSFDRQLIESRQLKIYAFDPTPGVEKFVQSFQDETDNFHFLPVGLGVKDREEWFYPPENPEHISGSVVPKDATRAKAFPVQMKTLSTIVSEARIDRFDLLKLDIEGAEYEVIPQILNNGFKPLQILVEVHPDLFSDGRKRTRKLVKLLNENGYQIFGVSNTCRELSFIRL